MKGRTVTPRVSSLRLFAIGAITWIVLSGVALYQMMRDEPPLAMRTHPRMIAPGVNGTLFVLRIQKSASSVMEGIIAQETYSGDNVGDATPVFTNDNELLASMPCHQEGGLSPTPPPPHGRGDEPQCNALAQLVKHGWPVKDKRQCDQLQNAADARELRCCGSDPAHCCCTTLGRDAPTTTTVKFVYNYKCGPPPCSPTSMPIALS